MSKSQVRKLKQIEPSHDGDTYVVTYPRRSPRATKADAIIRSVIQKCGDPGECGRTGVFILISHSGPPQLRVGSKWSTGSLETGLTYGTKYLGTQRRAAKLEPYAQASKLARYWSAGAAAEIDGFWFLDGLVNEAAGGLLAPDYAIGDGIIARTQRYVSGTTADLFSRQSGPVEAIIAFVAIGCLGRLLLNRWHGISGSIARPVFSVVYAAFCIPVAYGVLTLLGYRREDRILYPFDRGGLSFLYNAKLWAPIGNWWALLAIGVALLLATVLALFPFMFMMAYAEELKKTDTRNDHWFQWLVVQQLESSPDELLRLILRRLALPFALVWAAHAFLPALITYLLVLPAIVLLPRDAMVALKTYRLGQAMERGLA